jgi:hypothetical protein
MLVHFPAQLPLWNFQHVAYETEIGDLNCSRQWYPSQSKKKKGFNNFLT